MMHSKQSVQRALASFDLQPRSLLSNHSSHRRCDRSFYAVIFLSRSMQIVFPVSRRCKHANRYAAADAFVTNVYRKISLNGRTYKLSFRFSCTYVSDEKIDEVYRRTFVRIPNVYGNNRYYTVEMLQRIFFFFFL